MLIYFVVIFSRIFSTAYFKHNYYEIIYTCNMLSHCLLQQNRLESKRCIHYYLYQSIAVCGLWCRTWLQPFFTNAMPSASMWTWRKIYLADSQISDACIFFVSLRDFSGTWRIHPSCMYTLMYVKSIIESYKIYSCFKLLIFIKNET